MQNIRKRTARRLNGSRMSRSGVSRAQSGRGDRQMIAHPPQISSYGITRDVRMRFLVTGNAFNGPITFKNLLDTILVATTTSNVSDLFEAVRVNAVEAWYLPPPSGSTVPGYVTIIYDGTTVGAQGDQKTHTDSSMGIEPAHVKAKPDPLTQAGQWQASSSNTAFLLDCPLGTIIDVSCSFRQPVQGTETAAANGSGLVAGAVYYRGLDGIAAASSGLPIQGAVAVA